MEVAEKQFRLQVSGCCLTLLVRCCDHEYARSKVEQLDVFIVLALE